jgi:hypothetical protein
MGLRERVLFKSGPLWQVLCCFLVISIRVAYHCDTAAQNWPVFPAPPKYCTPRGLEIVTGEAENLLPTLPQPSKTCSFVSFRQIFRQVYFPRIFFSLAFALCD